ncbi:MAG: hypothetical protein HY904_21150 [Deltaproteobacteria bacterium]|nr:hypothetical protein [Deltaproteobacteria bacterium]
MTVFPSPDSAVTVATRAWPGATLVAFSAHGMHADGSLSSDALVCFLFRAGGAVRALAWSESRFTVLPRGPVPDELVPEEALGPVAAAPALAAVLCGQAGFDAWAGRPEDALWVGVREGRRVAILSTAGFFTLTVDAVDPTQVLSMDFEPVQLRAETV